VKKVGGKGKEGSLKKNITKRRKEGGGGRGGGGEKRKKIKKSVQKSVRCAGGVGGGNYPGDSGEGDPYERKGSAPMLGKA